MAGIKGFATSSPAAAPPSGAGKVQGTSLREQLVIQAQPRVPTSSTAANSTNYREQVLVSKVEQEKSGNPALGVAVSPAKKTTGLSGQAIAGSGNKSGSGGTMAKPPPDVYAPSASGAVGPEMQSGTPSYTESLQAQAKEKEKASGGGGGSAYIPPQEEAYEPEEDYSSYYNAPTSISSKPAMIASQASKAIVPVSATPGAAAKGSLWERFLGWLGLVKKSAAVSKTPAVMSGEDDNMQEACGQLVRRSRNGDQNAMAMIARVRTQAMRGNPKAVKAQHMLSSYIDKYPVGDSSAFAGEEETCDPLWCRAVSLSHGPKLSNASITDVLSEFGAENRQVFLRGMKHPNMHTTYRNPTHQDAHELGRITGIARGLQAVRMPDVAISKYDDVIGWELGE